VFSVRSADRRYTERGIALWPERFGRGNDDRQHLDCAIRLRGEQAPAPLLVNTSFNLFGEPLVVKPRDAVRSYFCSGIDALVIDNFVLSKTPAKIASDSVALPKAALI
ncbi:MAG: carbamoyltransferase C-terminal domain-containing protein, partial [Candidatus Sulfotelmatobacter sp.]